jgi:hypothetical protein
MSKHRLFVLISFVLFGAVVAGCASIMNGTRESVGISSSPSGAKVIIDNKEMGSTPVVADLKRKDHHFIKVEMEGYKPFEMAVTRKVSGWVWGNILFGGVIGLVVDAISGGLYKLEPSQVEAQMITAMKSSGNADGDLVAIAVVLEPLPGWEKIGQLEFE